MAKKPLIEEIDRVPGSSKSSSPDTFPVDYVLFSHPKSGTPKYLIGQFNLPRMVINIEILFINLQPFIDLLVFADNDRISRSGRWRR